MSDFFKNKKKMLLAFGSFFLAVTILAGSFAYLTSGMPVWALSQQPAIDEHIGELETLEDAQERTVEPQPEEGEAIIYAPRAPAQMRGVFLNPGVDFITGGDTTEGTLRSQMDKALDSAVELGMNTVIVNTNLDDQVIYQTRNAPELSSGFDILGYLMEGAGSRELFTYVIFDVSFYNESRLLAPLAVGAGTIDRLTLNLEEFLEKYPVDAVLIDGYETQATADSYGAYNSVGGGIGFENFLKQSPAAIVKAAADTVRTSGKGAQAGLLTSAVWANSDEHEEGSRTKSQATSLGSGNADTKSFVEKGLVDFVAVKAYGSLSDTAAPFEEVVRWWADVALSSDMPLYVVHAADKAGTQEAGWSGSDQLAKQVIALDGISGVRGSIFNDLSRLVDDPGQAATTLQSYYKEEVPAEYILTELEMTKPESTSFTTTEPTVTFTGASDPSQPVVINGENVPTDSSGYFTVTKELKGGSNTFTVSHKDKTVNYTITRQVEILRDMSPTGQITTEGGMSIQISAWAYQDAAVSASINGATVPMTIDESVVDESQRDSGYKLFVGQYTAPAATDSEQSLGSITVIASWNGESKSLTGASVKVNKKAKIENGVPVVVVADQARTYPPDTLDNVPSPKYYPLPKGAMDYAVGDEIVYKKNSDTYTYTVLASGLRVESKDIQAISNDYPSGNAISGMDVSTRDGYTYVTLSTAQQVSYSFSYASSGVSIRFHNTVSTPASAALSSNPLFSNATWNGADTLTLSFIATDGFMGYKGYYDGSGNLVFRFNNPPASLSGARIAIDPGHGGMDTGAMGFLSDYTEKVINRAIAERLSSELQSRGATVLLIDTSAGMELAERVARAEAFEADLLVSVHNNSGSRGDAKGTEVYYFYPYAKNLAASASANVSSQLATENRGAKASYYHATLSAQVPSVLVECGFMTNQAEYEKLISDRYQSAIAVGIADALSSAIRAANTGSSASGSQTIGSATVTTDDGSSQSDGSVQEGGEDVQAVNVSPESLSVEVGRSKNLQATVLPTTAVNKQVSWSSGNTTVATVDQSGRVTGVKEGTTRITVTTDEGDYTASSTVTVVSAGSSGGGSGVEVEEIDIDADEIQLDIGGTRQLTATVYPRSADDDTVRWSAANPSVASVDATGKVTGVGAGSTTVTATSNDGGYSISCRVTVSSKQAAGASAAPAAATGIPLADARHYDFDYGSEELYVGTTRTLEILSESYERIRPSDFDWKSSDTGVATVDANGVVTAKTKAGDADITATPKGGSSRDAIVCYVSVTRTKVPATGVSLNRSSLQLVKGQVYRDLRASMTPSNAATNLTWKSSNSRIASVDQDGVVTANARGTVTITVTAGDSRVRATCEVEVQQVARGVEDVELRPYRLQLLEGEEEVLNATVYPSNVSDASVTWTSSDTRVVTVDSSGKVTAVGRGSATVRATSNEDKNYYDECEIEVLRP